MALVTVYVKGPISGTITGRNKYCTFPYASDVCNGSGSTHGTCMSSSNPGRYRWIWKHKPSSKLSQHIKYCHLCKPFLL